jgi:hypothetical protein
MAGFQALLPCLWPVVGLSNLFGSISYTYISRTIPVFLALVLSVDFDISLIEDDKA